MLRRESHRAHDVVLTFNNVFDVDSTSMQRSAERAMCIRHIKCWWTAVLYYASIILFQSLYIILIYL